MIGSKGRQEIERRIDDNGIKSITKKETYSIGGQGLFHCVFGASLVSFLADQTLIHSKRTSRFAQLPSRIQSHILGYQSDGSTDLSYAIYSQMHILKSGLRESPMQR